MGEVLLCIGLALYVGYVYGVAEGRHRERWQLPRSRWIG